MVRQEMPLDRKSGQSHGSLPLVPFSHGHHPALSQNYCFVTFPYTFLVVTGGRVLMVPDGPTCHELFFFKVYFSWKLNSEKKYNLCYCCLKVSGFSFLLCSFYPCRKTGWYYFILRLLQQLDGKVFDSNYCIVCLWSWAGSHYLFSQVSLDFYF